MQITVKTNDGTVVYSRLKDQDAVPLTKVLSMLMNQNPGTAYSVAVSGTSMAPYTVELDGSFDLPAFVRSIEGPAPRSKKGA
jgi:F0F1-type ATP synthase beta subunit